MLPIILSPDHVVGLCGRGEAGARRAAVLHEAGIVPRQICEQPEQPDLGALKLLFIAGLAAPQALVQQARALGVLVNVEDKPELCDFHVPARIRRGDLLLTVSTGGRVPGLSRLIREWLDAQFSGAWGGQLETLEHARRLWRDQGLDMAQVSARVRQFVAEKGWLP